MYLQKLLTIGTLLFIGVSSLPQAITTDPSTDTPLVQEPATTGAPAGTPTGFGGPGGEQSIRHSGEGNVQSSTGVGASAGAGGTPLVQEPATTGAPAGTPTGFGGPGGEQSIRHSGEGNVQSLSSEMGNVQYGSNTEIGGDLTATNTFSSPFQTGSTLALPHDASAGAGARAGSDTPLTVAPSASATVYPTPS